VEDAAMIKAFAFALSITLLFPMLVSAQSTWEVTPYQVKVWYLVDEVPELPDAWKARLASTMQQQMRPIFAGACETSIESAPDSLHLLMKRDPGLLTREQLFAADSELAKIDKLFLLVLESNRQTFTIRLREFDCLLTHLGPVYQQSVGLQEQVLPRSVELIAETFSPVVRIERASNGMVKTRLRAGSLLQSPMSPGGLHADDLLLPYDRRVKNTGDVNLANIRPIDWTYLRAPKNVAMQGVRNLEIVSGFRQPFRSKRSRRLQQYAIRSRPPSNQSKIKLLSRSSQEPLIGYEIHEKGEEVTNLLGHTDWKGELLIPPSSDSIRTLLVRSGDRVLAKLPIVPGMRDEVVAYIRDDRLRVVADGFLSGVQMGIIDLVAQRESLTTRIRNRIEANDFDKANKLLDQFRKLPTQADFRRRVEQQLSALKLDDAGADSRLRTQITTTFVQTIGTLGKYLDPNRARELESELTEAQRRSG